MQYTKLGNSDLKVSRICMGCMGFGDAENGQHVGRLNEKKSREIIKKGLGTGRKISLIRRSPIKAAQASNISAGDQGFCKA